MQPYPVAGEDHLNGLDTFLCSGSGGGYGFRMTGTPQKSSASPPPFLLGVKKCPSGTFPFDQ